MVVAAACGGADANDDDEGARDEIGGVDPERRGRDQPLASDSTSVQPYVQGLLDAHSAAVDEILGNPELARDDGGPTVDAYVELYEPGSDVPDQVLTSWVEMADRGERARPSEEGAPMNVLRVDGEIEVISETEVRFPVCDEQNLVLEGSDGAVVETLDGVSLRGEGVAVHTDGLWYLRRIDLAEQPTPCATAAAPPGSDTTGGSGSGTEVNAGGQTMGADTGGANEGGSQ